MAGATQVILLVEDELLIRMAIADELREAGYEVIEASNATEALRVLDAPSQPIDILLTDVQMPGGIDGLALAGWVQEKRPEIVIAICSGAAWAITEAKLITRPELVFHKPVGGSTLARFFRQCIPPDDESGLQQIAERVRYPSRLGSRVAKAASLAMAAGWTGSGQAAPPFLGGLLDQRIPHGVSKGRPLVNPIADNSGDADGRQDVLSGERKARSCARPSAWYFRPAAAT